MLIRGLPMICMDLRNIIINLIMQDMYSKIKDLDNEITNEQQSESPEQQSESPEQSPVNPLDEQIEQLGNKIVDMRTIHTQGCLGVIDINDPNNAIRGADGMKNYGELIEKEQEEYFKLKNERDIQTLEGMSAQIQNEIDKTNDPDKIAHYRALQEDLKQRIDETKYNK